MLCESEGGDSLHELPTTARDDEQREHEQEMIDAGQNVLDAEHEVGPHNLPMARGCLDQERRVGGCQSFDLRCTVAAFHARQHVGERRGETLDADGATAQSTRALHTPALGVGVGDKDPARLGQVHAACRQMHIERQPQTFAGRRHLPQCIERIRHRLAQFQIGRPQFVGGGVKHTQHTEQQEHCKGGFPLHHCP
jgi:hypothetical protein